MEIIIMPKAVRKAKPPKTTQVTIRVPDIDLERAEKEAARMVQMGFSRTDVLRIAIALGLNQVAEIEIPKPRKESSR